MTRTLPAFRIVCECGQPAREGKPGAPRQPTKCAACDREDRRQWSRDWAWKAKQRRIEARATKTLSADPAAVRKRRSIYKYRDSGGTAPCPRCGVSMWRLTTSRTVRVACPDCLRAELSARAKVTVRKWNAERRAA